MGTDHIEKELKKELNRIDKELRRTENLRSAAWIGSGLGAGAVLATMADQVPILMGMSVCGALLFVGTRLLVSRKG